jgi:hypothetical protein
VDGRNKSGHDGVCASALNHSRAVADRGGKLNSRAPLPAMPKAKLLADAAFGNLAEIIVALVSTKAGRQP